LAKPGIWAGKFEARCLAEQLNIRMLIHTSWDEVTEINLEGTDHICFYISFNRGHCEYVHNADSNRWTQRKRQCESSPKEVSKVWLQKISRGRV